MSYDYALALDGDRMIAHKSTCPSVCEMADEGKPVVTLLGCVNPLPPEYLRASCLMGEEEEAT